MVGRVGCPVLTKDCWFQCCNDQCKKWRCVDPAVVDLLRGVEFLRPEATDLDWQLWISDARTRYACAQQRSGSTEVVAPNGIASLASAAEEGPPAGDAVTPDVDDGALTPDVEDGARTPSDGEVASEGDNPDAADGCVEGSVNGLPHVPGGQEQRSEVALPHKQRRLYASNTVKCLSVRRAKKFSADVVSFLVRKYGCRKSSLRIARAEAMDLWHGWCLMYPRLSKPSGSRQWEPSVCKREERLGWVLLEVKARAEALPVPAGGNNWPDPVIDDIEQRFYEVRVQYVADAVYR